MLLVRLIILINIFPRIEIENKNFSYFSYEKLIVKFIFQNFCFISSYPLENMSILTEEVISNWKNDILIHNDKIMFIEYARVERWTNRRSVTTGREALKKARELCSFLQQGSRHWRGRRVKPTRLHDVQHGLVRHAP